MKKDKNDTVAKLKKMVDKKGWTPLHYAVCPIEYGSYENEELLDILCKYFDVN